MDPLSSPFIKPFDITPNVLKTPDYLKFDISKYTSPSKTTSGTGNVQVPQPQPAVQGAQPQQKPKIAPTPKNVEKPKTSISKKKEKSAEDNYQAMLKKEIQNAYQQQIDFLSSQEANLQSQFPGQLQQLGAQYEALRPELQAQLTAQQEAGATAQEGIKATEQQNLATIRRQAEEQGLRAVQQFGGVSGSSTGQAASELLAREQLRAQGAARSQAVQSIQNVQQQLRTIQAEYDSNINKLNLEKEKALQTARTEFNRQLETIRASKAQAGVTKSNQTIAALQDFATRRRTIEDQSTALANNLTILKQQADSQANLLRLQASLATPATTDVNFGALFSAGNNKTIGQSNEAAKLLQSLEATGNLAKYGVTYLGKDPESKEKLYQTSYGIIDSSGNLRTGLGQYQKQNPGIWESLFGQ